MEKIHKYLENSLIKKAKFFDELRQTAMEILPEYFNEHIWLSKNNKKLIIFTDSQPLAMQLHYLQKKLCLHLNNTFNLGITVAHIKVIAPHISSTPNIKPRYKLSPTNARLFEKLAQEIDDQALSQAIKSLANSTTKNH